MKERRREEVKEGRKEGQRKRCVVRGEREREEGNLKVEKGKYFIRER